jgi:hypothetical protein
MGSPLENSFGDSSSRRSSGKFKFLIGALVLGAFPLVVSTFAASLTVGTGSLEFGQGSQQATACDSNVFVAMGEEWHPKPSASDSSDGFFRVRSVTISNLDLQMCVSKKLRLRLIDGSSSEITIGPTPESKVLQIALPEQAPISNIGDLTALQFTYLNDIGQPISTSAVANVALQVSGTSVYNGAPLSAQNADITFFLDPTTAVVNIDGQSVRRTTVETVDNPRGN